MALAHRAFRMAALIGMIAIGAAWAPTPVSAQPGPPDSVPSKRLPLLMAPGPNAEVPLASVRRRVTDFARPAAVVLLGGPWCKPCGPLYDSLSATASRLEGGRYGFAYVSFDDNPWEVWGSARLSGGIRAPILFEGDHLSAFDEWGVTGVPWMLVIDSTGRVLDHGLGTQPGLDLLRRVEADSGAR